MRDSFIIRYDGPALVDHSIDVNYLAPALLALGDLCRLANNEFNGGAGEIKVLANANLEQQCFEMTISLSFTAYEQIKGLIQHNDTATIKEIFEWLGIVASVGVAGGGGLFWLVKYLSGRQITSDNEIVVGNKKLIQLNVAGDNNTINISPQTYYLHQNPVAIKHIKTITKPLIEAGYESLELEHQNKITEQISKSDALSIAKINPAEVITDEAINTMVTWIKIYSPVYDPAATKWRFIYNNTSVYIDISETNIASEAFSRGGVFIDDVYKVELEITQTLSSTGKTKESYKIIKVLAFSPAPQSRQLRIDIPDIDKKKPEKTGGD